jgi:hypothetical protein
MPIVEANGVKFEFPDGTTEEQIGEAIDAHFSAKPQREESKQGSMIPAPVAEFASAANRSILGMADVVPKGINEALSLFGSDSRLPTFSGSASKLGVGHEGFMQPGLLRDVVQAAGETAPAAAATGGLLRQAATMAPNQMTSLLGGGSAGKDIAAGLLSGAGGQIGQAVGQEFGGDTGAAIGRNIGGIAAPMLTAIPAPSIGGRAAALRRNAPTTQSLKDASNAIYKQIDDMGVTIKPQALKSLASKAAQNAKASGLDPGITPKANALIQRLTKDADNPLTVGEVETLRKIASGISSSMDSTEASVGKAIAMTMDDFLDDIAADSLSGSSKTAGQMLRQARSLVQRRKKTELLQTAFENARNQASGFENGLRTQFRAILKRVNEGRLKGWTQAEKEALERVVQGGKIENILKFLGKFGLTEGQATSMLGSAVGIAGGAAVGGPVGAVGVPLAGQAAKYGAQAMTRNNAATAAALTASGPRAVVPGLLQSGVPQYPFSPAFRAGLLNTVEQ